LLEEYDPSEIRVLSPRDTQSLAYRIMHTESKSADERWLKKNLRMAKQPGQIRWRSIAKFKGRETEVVVLTDINEASRAFAEQNGKTLKELLYVGMSRARHRAVIIGELAPKL
jgi:superfamily I DNA/RNA helicase